MTRILSSFALFALCVCALGCSSKHGIADGGMGGAGGYYNASGGSGSPFGTGGTGTGTGVGAGTGGRGTAGTLAGTGGMARGTGGMMGTGGRMMTMVTCNTSVMSATSCGRTMCPAVPMNAQMCTVNCCMSNMCGTQRAVMTPTMMTTMCVVPAMPDSRCPSETVRGTMRQGCCTADNQCGLIRNTTCQPRDQVNGANLMALACDETDAGH